MGNIPKSKFLGNNLVFAKFLYNANLAGIYLLKVNNRNTRTKCKICSKLTIKTPGVVLMTLLLILNIFHTLF